MSHSGGDSGRKTKIDLTYEEFEGKLRELVPLSRPDIHPSDRIEAIIPPEERRHVWRELQLAGFDLPELTLSPQVFFIAAALVLAPVILLVLSLRRWSLLLSLLELSVLAHRLTRPLAIYPPFGCRTMQQLVVHLSRFVLEDYMAGLWTHDEIAAKVRQIFAEAAGVPVESVKGETRLEELFGC